MNTLLRISASHHNVRASVLLTKSRSLSGVSNSYLFTHGGRTVGIPPNQPLHLSRKNCSSHNEDEFPNLTDFPFFIWPRPLQMLRNRIMSSIVLRRYFDKDFDLDKFLEHSKYAVVRVSAYLAQGNLNELDELVTTDVLENIKENIKKLSLKERMTLQVEKRNIFACYAHNVGIILPDRKVRLIQELTSECFDEIKVIYHVFNGYRDVDFHQSGEPFMYPDFSRSFTVLNYRFIRNYSTGIDSYWIINSLSHSKPLHLAL